MKKRILLGLMLVVAITLQAQNEFKVPELSMEQKQKVLYDHVISYATSGISYAKHLGKTPAEYGKYVGKQFSAFWDPAGGLQSLGNGLMYIMAGMHPDNELQIVNQDEHTLAFKLKNVDLPFREGPMLGVSKDDYMEFSAALIKALANHMKLDFKQSIDDTWYYATLSLQR